MRVLMISPYVPFEGIDHAGGAYLQAYLTIADKERSIDLFAPWSEENERGARLYKGSARVHLLEVPAQPRIALGRKWWNARNFHRGLTPGWQVLAAMRDSADLRAATAACDLVEVHWDYMLPVLDHLPVEHRPVVAFPYDVVAQVFERRAAVAGRRTKWLLSNLTQRVLRQEVAYLNRTSATFLFSAKDVDLLQMGGLRVPAHVLDPLVSFPAEAAPLSGQSLLFAGAMHRPENVDAARWFLRTCWPKVREQVPTAQLVLAGSSPPEGLARGAPGVTVTGYVQDFDTLYRQARAAVVPLRAGAGLKFKVAQAMLWGLPVITTPIGAEGILDRSGPDAFAAVSNDPKALVTACVRVLLDDAHALQVGTAARAWARSAYDSQASMRSALERGEALVSARRP